MQITIEIQEQTGRITVMADGAEPYECSSTDECLEYLRDLMGGSAEQEGAEPDAEAMWNEEASKRPPTGLMT